MNLLFLHETTISEYLFVDKLFSLIPTIKRNESGNNRFFPLKLTWESNQIVIISFKIRYETWFLILLLAVLAYGNNCRIRLIIHRWRNSQLLYFSLFVWSHGMYSNIAYNFQRERSTYINLEACFRLHFIWCIWVRLLNLLESCSLFDHTVLLAVLYPDYYLIFSILQLFIMWWWWWRQIYSD